jgi:hypothetical protein
MQDTQSSVRAMTKEVTHISQAEVDKVIEKDSCPGGRVGFDWQTGEGSFVSVPDPVEQIAQAVSTSSAREELLKMLKETGANPSRVDSIEEKMKAQGFIS